PGQYLGCFLRHYGRDPFGSLCAVALSARDLRCADEGELERPYGSFAARENDPLSAYGLGHFLRHLSFRADRYDHGFGERAARPCQRIAFIRASGAKLNGKTWQ